MCSGPYVYLESYLLVFVTKNRAKEGKVEGRLPFLFSFLCTMTEVYNIAPNIAWLQSCYRRHCLEKYMSTECEGLI